MLDARVHYTILKPLPITTPASTSTAAASGLGRCLVKPLVVPGPNSVSVLSDHPPTVTRGTSPGHAGWTSGKHDVPPLSNPPEPHMGSVGGHHTGVLLRKEVIQPHLPVRLPCYDLVPITSPTLDGPLLTVRPPASGVTDFRDLTGGVYKARERIHRSVADLRLLATPTSRSRVADYDPN